MKTQSESFHQPRRKFLLLGRSNDRHPARRLNRRVKKIQLIYAHIGPPVVFSVTEAAGQGARFERLAALNMRHPRKAARPAPRNENSG